MNKKLSDLDCEYKRRVFGRARFLLLWMVISLCTATGCAEEPHYILWQEEVSLSDGHTVIATQKVRCEGGNTGAQYAPMHYQRKLANSGLTRLWSNRMA
jgi:hypothetical protein